MTSDKIHEQSWDKWDSQHLKLFIETLKSILYEIYVYPEENKQRSGFIKYLLQKVSKSYCQIWCMKLSESGGDPADTLLFLLIMFVGDSDSVSKLHATNYLP